ADRIKAKVIPWNGPKYFSVTGSVLQALGMAKVKVALTIDKVKRTVPIEVMVLDKVPVDILLGNNFNRKAKIIVNFGSDTLQFGSLDANNIGPKGKIEVNAKVNSVLKVEGNTKYMLNEMSKAIEENLLTGTNLKNDVKSHGVNDLNGNYVHASGPL